MKHISTLIEWNGSLSGVLSYLWNSILCWLNGAKNQNDSVYVGFWVFIFRQPNKTDLVSSKNNFAWNTITFTMLSKLMRPFFLCVWKIRSAMWNSELKKRYRINRPNTMYKYNPNFSNFILNIIHWHHVLYLSSIEF